MTTKKNCLLSGRVDLRLQMLNAQASRTSFTRLSNELENSSLNLASSKRVASQ
jgi:hypothetical protein